MSAEPQTLLVVDDDAEIRQMLQRALERAGYRVVQAEDGAAALERIHAARPDLVLLDIMMPRMDGLEVLRALRAEPALAELPVIAFTALTSQLIEKELFDLGVLGFFRKPLRLGDLCEMVGLELQRLQRLAAVNA